MGGRRCVGLRSDGGDGGGGLMRLFPSSQAWPAPVSAAAVLEAFDRARANGIASPGLRLGDFRFKLAPPAGRNAGAIYVTRNRTYLGKILYGRFPAGVGVRPGDGGCHCRRGGRSPGGGGGYGRETGRCACCRRLLTDPESVRVGIRPGSARVDTSRLGATIMAGTVKEPVWTDLRCHCGSDAIMALSGRAPPVAGPCCCLRDR